MQRREIVHTDIPMDRNDGEQVPVRLAPKKRQSRLGSSFEKTKPTTIPIGERRKPAFNGHPGYLRVDTVHQGDSLGENGMIHKKRRVSY